MKLSKMISFVKSKLSFFFKKKLEEPIDYFSGEPEDSYSKSRDYLFVNIRNFGNFDKLITSFSSKTFASFTGAGTSILTGIQSWNDCIEKFVEEVNSTFSVNLKLDKEGAFWQQRIISDIIRVFEEKTGTAKDFYAKVKSSFFPATPYTGYHDKIVELLNHHLTTNFDLLLEKRIREKHQKVAVQCLPELDFKVFSCNETLVYLHVRK